MFLLFLKVIYNLGISRRFNTENHTWILDKTCEFFRFFLSECLTPKCPDNLRAQFVKTLRWKCVVCSSEKYIMRIAKDFETKYA